MKDKYLSHFEINYFIGKYCKPVNTFIKIYTKILIFKKKNFFFIYFT